MAALMTSGREGNNSHKLVKAAWCYVVLCVKKSVCSNSTGKKGIVVYETKNTFQLLDVFIGSFTEQMAAAKSTESEYYAREGERTSNGNTGSRRAKRSRELESHTNNESQNKQTRAKTRIALTDDSVSQSSGNEVREKRTVEIVDLTNDEDDIVESEKSIDNSPLPKKYLEIVGLPKTGLTVTLVPKNDVIGSGSVKKVEVCEEVTSILKKNTYTGEKDGGSGQSKNRQSIALPKNIVHSLTSSKEDIEPSVAKNWIKVKCSDTVISEKKRDDRFNLSKTEELKSDVQTLHKSKHNDDELKTDRRESGTSSKTYHGCIDPDLISSVDEKSSRPVRNIGYAPDVALGNLTKESRWFPGDLAWGRVGQHPFWPCIIAKDPACGIYTKTKRVGRGHSVQQYLHVQFFGDSGKHSWIPTSSVIKYEGPDQFDKFAYRMINEMKKNDKKFLSAFFVKPSSKVRWELAIHEAELSVPKARGDRIEFFQELLPKQIIAVEKAESGHKNVTDNENGTKSSVQLVKKRNKCPNVSVDGKSVKLVKMRDEDARKKTENTIINASTRKKRGRNKN